MNHRDLEKYIIQFKEDLKIADTCKNIRTSILDAITQGEYFSPELAAYFVRDDEKAPFKVSSTDPSQVAVLKKLLNALENVEKAISRIENLDIKRDRYKIGIYTDLAKAGYNAVHEVAAALELINHSSSDIQEIVAPHIKDLMPKMAVAANALGQFTPSKPEESAGALLAGAIQQLPHAKHTKEQSLENLSTFIFDLPRRFEALQKLVATGASGIATKSITSPEDYQKAMIQRANETKEYFEKLSTKSGLLGLPSYIGVIRKLIAHSTDLVNTAAPLTKQAYLDAADKLNEIKHDLLPQLLAELEKIEEGMSLKPGTLTDPVLMQMNTYYTQLATQVEAIAQTAGVLDSATEYMDSNLGTMVRYLAGDKGKLEVGEKIKPIEGLKVMMDERFVEKRKANQATRLNEARFEADDNTAKEAATRFFDRLNSYNSIHQALCKWSLANVSQTERDALLADYKQFQTHFAAQHPGIDKLIVDALTLPTGTNIVSRLWSSEYKQLYGSNHFSKVLACKNDVMEHIEQSKAQANFRTRLIDNTMSHAEEVAYVANEKTTKLSADVQPYAPYVIHFEDGKSAEHYHKQGIVAANHVTKLEQARDGVKQFFDYLREYAQQGEPPRNTVNDEPLYKSLTAEDKEFLRVQYKKFQPQLVGMGSAYESLNEQLVAILNSPTAHDPKDPPLYLAHMLQQDTLIDGKLAALETKAKQDRNTYLDKEQVQKAKEVTSEPLTAKGEEVGKKTLFGMLSELKLSQSVDNFLQDKFQNYLRDNLSPEVWKQLPKKEGTDELDLDPKHLPYKDLHKDSEDVVMYKQLINSLHYMHVGLKELEALNNTADATNIFTRTWHLWGAFSALLQNINTSKFHLIEAARNPGLKAILQEGLDLLEPIKNIPILGDYVKEPMAKSGDYLNASNDASQIDVIQAWKNQQKIVERGLADRVPSETTVVAPVEEEQGPVYGPEPAPTSYVQLIAEKLYQLPVALNRLKGVDEASLASQEEVNKQVKSFVDGLNGLSFGPGTANKVLNTIAKFQMQVSEIGALSHDLALARLKEIRSEFGAIFMEAADSAEFHLGLKPGTYSDVVKERFDRFYESLIVNVATEFKKDQDGLVLLLDLSDTQKRLAREEKRKNDIHAASPADVARGKLTSANYNEFAEQIDAFDDLAQIRLECDVPSSALTNDFPELQEKASRAYDLVQPLLAEVDPKFTVDFIDNAYDELELQDLLGEVLAAQNEVLKPTTIFENFQLLVRESNFESEADQKKFLQYYAELQPYLSKIDNVHNVSNFNAYLRELQEPSDFKAQGKKIVAIAPKLQELIKGLEDAKELKIKLCDERINHLKGMIKEQQEVIGPERIAAFKDKLFSNYLNANLKSALEAQIGPHAKAFFEYILPELNKKKAEIVSGIDITQDMEALIAQRIDDASQIIIGEQKESFKAVLFEQQVQEAVKKSAGESLGFYAGAFLKAIQPDYKQAKAVALNGIEFNEQMGEKIASSVGTVVPLVLEINKELQGALSKLNKTLETVNNLIEQEQAFAETNPCRAKKLALLTELKEQLTQLDVSKEADKVDKVNAYAEERITAAVNYDAIINIYDVLNELKEKITTESMVPQEKEKRLHVISAIQDGLADESLLPFERLEKALSRLSAASEQNVLRGANHYLVGDAYKGQLFDNHLNVTLVEQMQGELGPYATAFIQQISPDFMTKKSEIIMDLAVDDKTEAQIAEKSKGHWAQVCSKNHEAKDLCTLLNQSLKIISQVIEEEERIKSAKPGNPGREEKINQLKKYQSILAEGDNIPEQGRMQYLQRRNAEVQDFLARVPHYDSIIKVHDSLNEMKAYVNTKETSVLIKGKKIEEISKMQAMLEVDSKEPSERLADVKSHGLSEKCQDVLHKNSDNPFVKLIKKFVSFFTGPTQEETMMSSFKQRLQDIKVPAVDTPQEQSNINLGM
ncbi:hypothetical protein [Legionella rowbothamii]|uniref:hypothetical protein n=1 Tax=Legionella rowbothamii TaxID=96229 RepID=UPI00105594EA|nr:hypothetical protein [Legionella rowbothamii]